MLWFAESATYKYTVDVEGVKGPPGVQWVGGVAWTDVWHVVKMHLGDIG